MRLREAVEQAECGDTIENTAFCGTFRALKEKAYKMDGLTGAVAMSDQWKIIPAEPKVLTAEEIIKEKRKIFRDDWIAANTLDFVNMCGAEFHQNGRLERDLELRGGG